MMNYLKNPWLPVLLAALVILLFSTLLPAQDRSFLIGVDSKGLSTASYLQEENFIRFEVAVGHDPKHLRFQTKMIFQKQVQGVDFGVSVPYLDMRRRVDEETGLAIWEKRTPVELSMRKRFGRVWITTKYDFGDTSPQVGIQLKLL